MFIAYARLISSAMLWLVPSLLYQLQNVLSRRHSRRTSGRNEHPEGLGHRRFLHFGLFRRHSAWLSMNVSFAIKTSAPVGNVASVDVSSETIQHAFANPKYREASSFDFTDMRDRSNVHGSNSVRVSTVVVGVQLGMNPFAKEDAGESRSPGLSLRHRFHF